MYDYYGFITNNFFYNILYNIVEVNFWYIYIRIIYILGNIMSCLTVFFKSNLSA